VVVVVVVGVVVVESGDNSVTKMKKISSLCHSLFYTVRTLKILL